MRRASERAGEEAGALPLGCGRCRERRPSSCPLPAVSHRRQLCAEPSIQYSAVRADGWRGGGLLLAGDYPINRRQNRWWTWMPGICDWKNPRTPEDSFVQPYMMRMPASLRSAATYRLRGRSSVLPAVPPAQSFAQSVQMIATLVELPPAK